MPKNYHRATTAVAGPMAPVVRLAVPPTRTSGSLRGVASLATLLGLWLALRLQAAGPGGPAIDRLMLVAPSLAPELVLVALCVGAVAWTQRLRVPAGLLAWLVAVLVALQTSSLEVLGTYASLQNLHGVTFAELLGYGLPSLTPVRLALLAASGALAWMAPLAGLHRVRGRPLASLATFILATIAALLMTLQPAEASFVAPTGSPLLAMVAPEQARPQLYGQPAPHPEDWAPAGALTPQWSALATVPRDFNVVVVVLESTRASEFWPASSAPPMPTLASLASSSVVFDRAYSHDGRSIKGLEAILLGIYTPPRWEAIAWNQPDLAIDSVTARWSSLGLRTAFLQSADVLFDNQKALLTGRGLDRIQGRTELARGSKPELDNVLVDALGSFVRADPRRPFGAILWPIGTHIPYVGGRRPEHPLDSHEAYRDTLEELDRFLGELVRALKASGKWERTVLMLVGDHGESFGEHPVSGLGHGTWPFEESSHVPLILVNAQLFHGEHDPRIVQTKDVAPTAAWLAGDDRATLNMGVSLFHERAGESAYFSNHFNGYAEAIVHGPLKYMQVRRGGQTQERLFDVLADPGEQHDLMQSRQRDATALRDRLAGWHATWSDRWDLALSPVRRHDGPAVAHALFPEPGNEVRWQKAEQLTRHGPAAKAYAGGTSEETRPQ